MANSTVGNLSLLFHLTGEGLTLCGELEPTWARVNKPYAFHDTASLTHMVNLHKREYSTGVTGEPTDKKFN